MRLEWQGTAVDCGSALPLPSLRVLLYAFRDEPSGKERRESQSEKEG